MFNLTLQITLSHSLEDSVILKPQTPGPREDIDVPEENGVEDFEMDVDGDVEIQMEQDFDESEEFRFEANHSEAEFNPPGKSSHLFFHFLTAFHTDLPSNELRLSFEVADTLNIHNAPEEVCLLCLDEVEHLI